MCSWFDFNTVAEQCTAATWEQMDVPVPQDEEEIISVPVGVRQQVLLNGDWVTVTRDVAEYTKKLITSVARLKRKVNLTVVPDSHNVESERQSRNTDVKCLISDLLNRLQVEPSLRYTTRPTAMKGRFRRPRRRRISKADTAKNSSIHETAVSWNNFGR